ncbi:NADH:flavin oxidoreductase [Geobacter argillaceus]|uniref:2,4-dienoyl-CoA reductase-like NADH-dependent reductase (Old Yellow Enzyme family) n=1 Tax=Geobacter argillaceus TaxID=345631 RepID=A0A562V8E2_9BACT|nr:NADH:flavin oxidoreductase [Geobacter argillaceus]TWJ14007.1 2,4-dienoyl-CoA reductase-like NADH-dependent reductase (Old Yellow Enzyme family) [Geobacter argillaceus]
MKSLFDRTHFAGLHLKNRFFRSATRDGFADERGQVTPELVQIYENLAMGGVGTIITGHAYVTDREQSKQPCQMGIYDDSLIDGYTRLTDTVHRHNVNIIMQISCVGAQTYAGGQERLIWGPSPIEDLATRIIPEEMSGDEILYLQTAFADAALRAQKAGFDGVQIHAAHGYVLNKFLNPYYNRRTDAYGGTIDNRARMLIETYLAMRGKVGTEFPILIKINCSDFMDQGMTFDECRYVCKKLVELGLSAIEVSGGNLSSPPNEGPVRIIKKEQEHYFKRYAVEIAQEVDAPVILVGGNRDFKSMEEMLNQTDIEYFSLSRPLICESDLINRWQSGDLKPARCISCNKCLGLEHTSCILNK